MAGLGGAIHEIHSLENLAERGTFLCRIHPLSKVLVTIWYLVLVMSFGNDDISGLMGMALYPAVLMITGDISLKAALKRMRPLLLMVCLIGAANPFLDRRACFAMGRVTVTAGMLSMVSLLLKTGFAVFASYILIAAKTPRAAGCCDGAASDLSVSGADAQGGGADHTGVRPALAGREGDTEVRLGFSGGTDAAAQCGQGSYGV